MANVADVSEIHAASNLRIWVCQNPLTLKEEAVSAFTTLATLPISTWISHLRIELGI
jgi:hypothetical protein